MEAAGSLPLYDPAAKNVLASSVLRPPAPWINLRTTDRRSFNLDALLLHDGVHPDLLVDGFERLHAHVQSSSTRQTQASAAA